MNVSELPGEVWIGEAIHDGERIERVVHLTEDDAHEDIRTIAPDRGDVLIRVEREQLLTGRVSDTEELEA